MPDTETSEASERHMQQSLNILEQDISNPGEDPKEKTCMPPCRSEVSAVSVALCDYLVPVAKKQIPDTPVFPWRVPVRRCLETLDILGNSLELLVNSVRKDPVRVLRQFD